MILIEFKFRISYLFSRIILKQRNLNQIGHCLTGHNQILHYFLIEIH